MDLFSCFQTQPSNQMSTIFSRWCLMFSVYFDILSYKLDFSKCTEQWLGLLFYATDQPSDHIPNPCSIYHYRSVEHCEFKACDTCTISFMFQYQHRHFPHFMNNKQLLLLKCNIYLLCVLDYKVSIAYTCSCLHFLCIYQDQMSIIVRSLSPFL